LTHYNFEAQVGWLAIHNLITLCSVEVA